MKKYFQAPWSSTDLYKIIGVTLAMIVVTLGLIAKFVDFQQENGVQIFGGFLLQWLLILTPLLIFTVKKYKIKAETFGLTKVKISTVLYEILRAYGLFIGINFLITLFILYTNIKIPGYQVQQNIAGEFTTTGLEFGIGIVMITIIAPIIEEIFFRGFLLRTIVNSYGLYLGSIITALIFSFLHIPWQSFIPIFILGLIINSMTIRTKSIIPGISFHILNNLIAFTIQALAASDIINIKELFISFT